MFDQLRASTLDMGALGYSSIRKRQVVCPATKAPHLVPTKCSRSWGSRYFGGSGSFFSEVAPADNVLKAMGVWWASRESNTAPTDYESAALTRHELEARYGTRRNWYKPGKGPPETIRIGRWVRPSSQSTSCRRPVSAEAKVTPKRRVSRCSEPLSSRELASSLRISLQPSSARQSRRPCWPLRPFSGRLRGGSFA